MAGKKDAKIASAKVAKGPKGPVKPRVIRTRLPKNYSLIPGGYHICDGKCSDG